MNKINVVRGVRGSGKSALLQVLFVIYIINRVVVLSSEIKTCKRLKTRINKVIELKKLVDYLYDYYNEGVDSL